MYFSKSVQQFKNMYNSTSPLCHSGMTRLRNLPAQLNAFLLSEVFGGSISSLWLC